MGINWIQFLGCATVMTAGMLVGVRLADRHFKWQTIYAERYVRVCVGLMGLGLVLGPSWTTTGYLLASCFGLGLLMLPGPTPPKPKHREPAPSTEVVAFQTLPPLQQKQAA